MTVVHVRMLKEVNYKNTDWYSFSSAINLKHDSWLKHTIRKMSLKAFMAYITL